MKHLLVLFCFTISFVVSGQNWIECSIDSSVSVIMPQGYESKETNNQFIFRSTIAGGALACIKLKGSDGNTLYSPEELRKYYTTYLNGVMRVLGGVLEWQKEEMNGSLMYSFFKINFVSNNTWQSMYYKVIALNSGIYIMRFSEVVTATDTLSKIRNDFFESLTIAEDVRLKSQMSPTSANMQTSAESFLDKYFFWIAAGLLLLAAAVILVKKKA